MPARCYKANVFIDVKTLLQRGWGFGDNHKDNCDVICISAFKFGQI